MKLFLSFLKKRRKIFFFLVLPLLVTSVLITFGYYKYISPHESYSTYGSGFLEQQRKLWNDYMDQSPEYLFNEISDYPQLFSENGYDQIKPIKDEIYFNARDNANSVKWEVNPPEKINLEDLSFGAMTEKELLNLPDSMKNLEYYAELLSRFESDDITSLVIIQSMQQKGIKGADFLLQFYRYKVIYPGIGKPEIDINREAPLLPGFQQYGELISSGNYDAYAILNTCGWNSHTDWAQQLEKHLRERADKGDPVAQRQLGNLIMSLLARQYSQNDTKANWEQIEKRKGLISFLCEILPDSLNEWPKKLSSRRSLIRKLPEWPRFAEALEWYKKAAEAGDGEAMFAWTRGNFNYIPRYLSRDDWHRMLKYYTIMSEKGDWRVYTRMTYNWAVTLEYIPFICYSYRDRLPLLKAMRNHNRGAGSIKYIRELMRRSTYMSREKRKNLPYIKAMNTLSPYMGLRLYCSFGSYTGSSAPSLPPIKEMTEKNAESGDPAFLYALAWMYEQGIGCEKDYAKAAQLLEKAYLSYDKCYRNQLPFSSERNIVPLTYAIPASIIELNMKPDYADRNPARALELALLFQNYKRNTFYTDQTPTELIAPTFSYYLGKMYEQGIGTPKDISKALEYYKKGCEQKNPHSLLEMGRCYEQGIGVTADKKQALAFYEKAQDNCISKQLFKEIKKRKTSLENKQD